MLNHQYSFKHEHCFKHDISILVELAETAREFGSQSHVILANIMRIAAVLLVLFIKKNILRVYLALQDHNFLVFVDCNFLPNTGVCLPATLPVDISPRETPQIPRLSSPKTVLTKGK